MRPLSALTLLVVLLPGSARAQDAPEALLPAGSQLYLRWDGIAAHRDAYRQTAMGKMMQGDMGIFVENVFAQLKQGIGSVLTVEQLLGGAPPEKLQQMQSDANEAAQLIPLIGEQGFILAVHLSSLEPPQGQVTLIIPNVGEKITPVIGALRLVASLNKIPIQEKKLGKRNVYHIPTPFVHVSWWLEGKHAMINVSTSTPEELIAQIEDSKPETRLVNSALFKRVQGFKEFTTGSRAYLDVATLVKIAETRGDEARKLIKDLGIDGLKTVVLYSGFEGNAERGLVEVDMPGPRKGLLELFEGKPFTMKDLPPLPPDVSSFTMTTFQPAKTYDVVYDAIERITTLVAPDQKGQVKEAARQVNQVLGIDLRKDLLEGLGDRLAYYLAPSEGPLSLGAVALVQVKNPQKVQDAVEQMIKGLARSAGGDVRLRKRTYHGVEIHEVHIKQQGAFFVPTYAIHDGWLVFSYFPQPVHGYLLRARGELEAWKPSPSTQKALDSMPKQVQSISFSDPRPSIRTLLTLAPLIAGLANSFNPEPFVEVGALPHSQEVNRHLFPNVSVSTLNQKGMRIESRASLTFPVEIAGIESYVLLIFFSAAASRF